MNKNIGGVTSKPKWDWTQVDCNLKLQINRKYVNWSLAPQIVLTNPTGEGPDPNVKMFVDTEKSLQFNQESQWNWHKSWNLPNIAVRVEVKDSSTGEALLAPKKLFAQLVAVKAVPEPHDKQETTHLVDVGIRGNSKIQMEDGQAFFTAMKFSSTSYNHEGVKFYLLLVLYINAGAPTDTPKILTSIISPPIFVDSRKSARDNHEKKNESFIEPFLIENLQKQFIKRENKKRSQNQIKIKNDFEGLFNYLTAPNIRHKVKHPLFIAIKFSQCAKIFFNTSQLGKSISLSQLINSLQRKISKDHYSRNATKGTSKIQEKMFILQIVPSNDSMKNKKVAESIDPVECSSLGIVYNGDPLPSFFENFSTLGNMASVYKDEYSQLYITTRSIFDAEVSEGDESEAQSQEEKKQQSQSNEEKSQSEKQSSYPEYNPRNSQKIPQQVVVQQKVFKPEIPLNFDKESIQQLMYKRSLSDPLIKKSQIPKPVQVPIPQISLASRQTANIQTQIPHTPLINFGVSQLQPPQMNNYMGDLSMEQLYMNNLMLSNAINNLKPVSSPNMPYPLMGNNLGMYNMPRTSHMDVMAQQGKMIDYSGMLFPNMGSSLNQAHTTMPQSGISQPSIPQSSLPQGTPTKVGFSPTIPQSDIQMTSNPINPINQMNSISEQQYLLAQQQASMYKQLYLQLWQNQQRGMMQGQPMMPNMNQGMPSISSMSHMNPQMNMNAFQFLDNHGFPETKKDNN